MTGNSSNTLTPYLIAQGTQFAAGGMMAVVFPWLIVHELHESQVRVGFAQAIVNLPFLLLVLVAGAVADGRDLRRFLPRIQLAMAMFPIVLALIIAVQGLSFFSATALLFAMSVFGSFATPARDALLSHVTPHSLGLARASALAVAATFGGQVLGTLAAASASSIGAVPLLACQSALLVVSALITARLVLVTPFTLKSDVEGPRTKLHHDLLDGFGIAWNNERLRTIILYLILGAPLFNGMFLVGVPLMVRDVFHGSSAMLSVLITAFLTGLTISSFAFSRQRPVERPGRLLMLLSSNNIIVFVLAHFTQSSEFFAGLMFAWGLTSGVGMSLTRGMIQIAAPHAYRARIMSMLQFSQMAGGPIGALLFGFAAQAIGILNTVLIIPASVVAMWLVFRFTTRLWDFRREEVS